ncbi:MAG TPA: MliC family protein [Alphaproteobacteria bacterium]|jgi:membrane-bound inhibitor of C-type lysozyme|nr:MliC family protein [Alphaproteobacteria bacterium]
MHRRHYSFLLRPIGAALLAGLAACAGTGERDSLVGPIYYACADRSDFSVTFDNEHGVAIVERPDAPRLMLPQRVMGSGFRYGDGANELTGKGREATWRAAGVPPVPCTAQ